MTVGPLPIVSVHPPDDLAGIYGVSESGHLLPSQLISVGPQGQLHHDAARAYKALAFRCMAIGLPLTYTYGGCYRSYGDQVNLFGQRYETPAVPGRATKTWNGKVYSIRYVNGKPMAMAATPGTSNHGWAIAIDYAFDSDVTDGIGPDDATTITSHPQWPTFKVYAQEHGFSWETTSEPWHLRLVVGSTPTQATLDVEAYIASIEHPTPVPPTPNPIPSPGDDMKLSILTLSNTQPPTTFLGYAEPHPNGVDQKFWEVLWIDGNDPQQMKMLNDQRAAGAVEYKYGEHVSASLWLSNKVLPSSVHADGSPWRKDQWGYAPNVEG